MIELRLLARVDLHVVFIAEQAQQEPPLLLTDADRARPAPDVSTGKAVTQPVARLSHELDMFVRQPELLLELAIQGVDRGFVRPDTALRELPGVLADSARPQHATRIVVDDDSDVGSESVFVDHRVSLGSPPSFERLVFHHHSMLAIRREPGPGSALRFPCVSNATQGSRDEPGVATQCPKRERHSASSAANTRSLTSLSDPSPSMRDTRGAERRSSASHLRLVLDDRRRLLAVDVQPVSHGGLPIIVPLHQGFSRSRRRFLPAPAD